jgi:hypothetical protein
MDKRAETIEAARQWLRTHSDMFTADLLKTQMSQNIIADHMANFHLSQSRDAWTPVTKVGDYPQEGGYLVTLSNGAIGFAFCDAMFLAIEGLTWQVGGHKVIAYQTVVPYEQEK